MTDRKLLVTLVLLACLPAPGLSQGFNGRARTYLSGLQIREWVLDSVPAGWVGGSGAQRVLADGTPAVCNPDFCTFYRSGHALGVIPVLQDVEINAWPGITGLRAYAHLRLRESIGEWRRIWPGMEERFEAMSAWVEYTRSFYRLQAGRIWKTSALGFYNYDGGTISLRLPTHLDVAVFGGLSLVRGAVDLRPSGLLSPVEPLGPREDAYLGGAEARWRPFPALSASFIYQREEATHSGDLFSERMGGSARLLFRGASLEVEGKYDLAREEVNLARAAVTSPVFLGLQARAEARRYRPYFDLWTLWGAFSPVGYDEIRGRLDWSHPSARASLFAYGAYRAYEETGAKPSEGPALRDDGWRMGAGGRLAFSEGLALSAEYRYDEGFGATRHGGDLSLQRWFGAGTFVALTGTAFETFSEFQVGAGRVWGGGLSAGLPLGPASLSGSFLAYKHRPVDRPGQLDLNQIRASLILEIPFGQDPGLRGRGNR